MVIFIIIFTILFISLMISLYLNFRLGKTILTLEDQVEESLDILNNCYASMNEIALMPIAFDDPQVRQILHDIQNAKNSVLLIANKLTVFARDEDQNAEK